MPTAAAEGSHTHWHAAAHEVSVALRESRQVHARQQREGEGGRVAQRRAQQGDPESRESGSEGGRGSPAARRDPTYDRSIGLRQIRSSDRAGVQEPRHHESQADLRGTAAVASGRTESLDAESFGAEAGRLARGAARRHDLLSASAGRQVSAQIHQHDEPVEQFRAQSDRQTVHRAGAPQCR